MPVYFNVKRKGILMKKICFFIVPILMAVSFNIFGMGGTIPSGLPTTFGFGCMDDLSVLYKDDQGTCWDYSYCYLTQGWRSWNGDDPSYPLLHAEHFEPYGQHQVVTFYYVNDDMSQYTGTAFMTTYFNDLKLLFQKINTYATKKVIVHIDPDLIGFWTGANYTATQTGVVAVGSTGISEISACPNTIQGWNKAIHILRDTYAPDKALIAIHISEWSFGNELFNTSMDESTMTTKVATLTNFISSMENGYKSDLFFMDIADRDADWRRVTAGGGNTYWTENTYTYTSNRSFGKIAAFVDKVSTNLSRRLMLWQIPVGNTYFTTCNNSAGHYRDNYVQNFIPCTSDNGASGSPGDAYSSSGTSKGPGYWASKGVIGILFGPGAGTCTHHWNYNSDGATNPSSDIATPAATYEVWGKATPTYADDDGGYLRLAVAKYCSTGKFAIYTPTSTITGTPPSPTVTPTYTQTEAVCSTTKYDGETSTTNFASGNYWLSGGSVKETASAAHSGSYGIALDVTWTGTAWYGGFGWNWAKYSEAAAFDASKYAGIQFYMKTTLTANTSIACALVDTLTASASVSLGTVTSTWTKFTIPLASFTAANSKLDLSRLWAINITFGGSAAGEAAVYFDDLAFVNDCTTPTMTITGTPPSPTMTATLTPMATVCSIINYDGETSTTNLASGGAWANPTGSSASEVSTVYHGGSKSLAMSFIWASGSWGGGGWNWAGWNYAKTTDLTSVDHIEFWVRASDATANTYNTYSVNLDYYPSGNTITASASSSVALPSITTAWQKYIIPISSFSMTGLTNVSELDLNVGGSVSGNITIYIDDIAFVMKSCVTATITSSSTATVTRTLTPSPSETFTRTVTMTFTSTYTATDTPTNSINTATNTPTASGMGTSTYTVTTVNSASPSPTVTVTASSTGTRTFTMTFTPTYTYTSTPTGTMTGTRTATMTFTPPSTLTDTVTVSPTATVSQTHTVSPTVTETITGTPPTATDSPTVTQTLTVTLAFTSTMSCTPTYSCTATDSPTFTLTVTGTYTTGPGATQTWTGTETATDTALPSSTLTGTATLTVTITNTPVPVSTAAYTTTTTLTPTRTSSVLPVSTATSTAAFTYTGTPTNTVALTATPTLAGTTEFTATLTVTPASAATVVIEKAEPKSYPNPVNPLIQDLHIGFYVESASATVYFRMYSSASRLIRDVNLGNQANGWQTAAILRKNLAELSNGVYFFIVVQDGQDGKKTRSSVNKIIILK